MNSIEQFRARKWKQLLFYRESRPLELTIANEMAEARRRQRLSMASAAKLLGVEPGTLRRWESGQTQPDMLTVSRMCAAYLAEPCKVLGVPHGTLGMLRVDDIGSRIMRARSFTGTSRVALAYASGWSCSIIRSWEYDQRIPKPKACRDLANAMGVTIEWIMGFKLAQYQNREAGQ